MPLGEVFVLESLARFGGKGIIAFFKGGVINHSEIFSLTQLKAWSWITSYFAYVCFFFSDWCLDPLTCLLSI